MLRHLTRLASVVRPPATVSATPLPVTSLPGLPWTVSSSSSLLISSSRLLSTRVLTPSLITTPFQRWTPSTSVDSPAASFDSESVSILAAFPNLQLAESRRYAKRFKGSSARKGRPWKDRTMRHKEWLVFHVLDNRNCVLCPAGLPSSSLWLIIGEYPILSFGRLVNSCYPDYRLLLIDAVTIGYGY